MRESLKLLLRATAEARRHHARMQYRLLLYWLSMVLALFALLALVLSLSGVFSASEQRLQQVLELQEDNICANLNEYADALEARGIALSENVGRVLEETLYMEPVSALNDTPDEILALQRAIYPYLNASLGSGQCSGAFVLLDATTNTAAPTAATSRTGLYLRLTNLSVTTSARQDVTYFRGIPDIAREHSLELHNRWNLEFDTGKLPWYEGRLASPPDRLADACAWSGRLRLTDTWESVALLTVPIMGGDGSVAGLCGLEVSDLYFRLRYPAASGKFGNLITVLAPVEDGSLLLERGMVGSQEGTSLGHDDQLRIRTGRRFHTYTGQSGTFVGLHRELDLPTISGAPLAAVTLLPQESYFAALRAERTAWIIGTASFLLLMLLSALYLSRRFVRPITAALQSIRDENWETRGPAAYTEIDDLFDFLAQKDREYEERMTEMERRRQSAEDEAARAQTEMERLRRLDPERTDYQLFLVGLSQLTPTEREVFELYLAGCGAREILERLQIKENTLKYHNKNIYAKLGVSSRKQLLLYAAQMKHQERQEKRDASPPEEKNGR